MSDNQDIEKLGGELLSSLDQAIQPSWIKKGKTNDEFANELKSKLESLKQMMKSGQGDKSLVKSTLTESVEFLSWLAMTKELQNAKTLIQAQLVREKQNGINKRSIKTK